MPGETVPYRTDYEFVAAGQTDQQLGPVGAVGDVLENLLVTVTTAATSAVELQDGDAAAMVIVPANTPIGVYSLRLSIRAKTPTAGGWKVTTAAGVAVLATGRFT